MCPRGMACSLAARSLLPLHVQSKRLSANALLGVYTVPFPALLHSTPEQEIFIQRNMAPTRRGLSTSVGALSFRCQFEVCAARPVKLIGALLLHPLAPLSHPSPPGGLPLPRDFLPALEHCSVIGSLRRRLLPRRAWALHRSLLLREHHVLLRVGQCRHARPGLRRSRFYLGERKPSFSHTARLAWSLPLPDDNR